MYENVYNFYNLLIFSVFCGAWDSIFEGNKI